MLFTSEIPWIDACLIDKVENEVLNYSLLKDIKMIKWGQVKLKKWEISNCIIKFYCDKTKVIK